MALRLLGAFIIGIVLLTAATPAAAQVPLSVPLSGAPGVGGQAIVSVSSGTAQVTIEAEGLEPGREYLALINAGTCAQPSASVGTLGRFQANAQRRGRLETRTVAAQGGWLGLRLDWLADGSRVVVVRDAAGATVACGSIPAAVAAPVQLPRTGGAPSALAAAGLILVAVGVRLRPR